MTRVTVRRAALAGVTLAALAVGGCGGSDGGGHSSMPGMGATSAPAVSASAAATFNDADVTFAQMMIEHHRQAVQMAELAPARASGPEVKQLAEKVKAAQQPEIDTMTGWLSAWGKPVPDAGDGIDHAGMGHGAMPGMMSDADMDKLAGAKGAAFDKQFLTMMIAHHEGAITMAEDQTTEGGDPDAKALAATVVIDQQAEITEMKAILAKL